MAPTPEQLARMKKQLARHIKIAEGMRAAQDADGYERRKDTRPTRSQVIDYLWRHDMEPEATTRAEYEAVAKRADHILQRGIFTGTEDYHLMLAIEKELGIDRKALFYEHEAQQEKKKARVREERQQLNAEGATVAQQTFDNRLNSAEERAHLEYMSGDIKPRVPGINHKQILDYIFDNGILSKPKPGDEHRATIRLADEVLIKGQLGSQFHRDLLRACEAAYGINR